jgi:hypothetical protein
VAAVRGGGVAGRWGRWVVSGLVAVRTCWEECRGGRAGRRCRRSRGAVRGVGSGRLAAVLEVAWRRSGEAVSSVAGVGVRCLVWSLRARLEECRGGRAGRRCRVVATRRLSSARGVPRRLIGVGRAEWCEATGWAVTGRAGGVVGPRVGAPGGRMSHGRTGGEGWSGHRVWVRWGMAGPSRCLSDHRVRSAVDAPSLVGRLWARQRRGRSRPLAASVLGWQVCREAGGRAAGVPPPGTCRAPAACNGGAPPSAAGGKRREVPDRIAARDGARGRAA